MKLPGGGGGGGGGRQRGSRGLQPLHRGITVKSATDHYPKRKLLWIDNLAPLLRDLGNVLLGEILATPLKLPNS